MTTGTPTKIGMPLDAFLELGSQQAFELIGGERIPKLPNVAIHSEIIRLLFRLLDAYALALQAGEAYNETTFILPDTYDSDWVSGSRIPDLMFYTGTRMADYKSATPEWKSRPFSLVPDLVIEVVSPNDKVTELEKKIDLYLADGVRLIWVVNPELRKVTTYAPDLENPIVLKGDALLDGGDVLPGFQVRLAALFEQHEPR